MSNDIIIARLAKSRDQHIRVSLGEFKGHQHFSVRIWVEIEGEQKPTGKGVNLKLEQFDELIEALQKARAEAERIGWLGQVAA